MEIIQKGDFIKIESSLFRISKIDTVKLRTVIKANNFGKVSDELFPEIMISLGTDKHVFVFKSETEQAEAFIKIEKIIAGI